MNATITVRFIEGGGGCLSEVTLTGDPADALELTNMFTHPRLRRKGYARRVLSRAVEFSDNRGFDLWLRIVPFGKNGAAYEDLRKLYAAAGFSYGGKDQMNRLCRGHKYL